MKETGERWKFFFLTCIDERRGKSERARGSKIKARPASRSPPDICVFSGTPFRSRNSSVLLQSLKHLTRSLVSCLL